MKQVPQMNSAFTCWPSRGPIDWVCVCVCAIVSYLSEVLIMNKITGKKLLEDRSDRRNGSNKWFENKCTLTEQLMILIHLKQ